MASVPWYKRSLGLANKFDPGRIEYTEKEGVRFLAEAYNVDIGETGDVARRMGYAATAVTAACHSLWCEDGICLFVTGDALCILHEDMSYTALRNVTIGAKMQYAQLGSTVFYTNGSELGGVTDNRSWVWELPATVRSKDSTRVYSDPILGSIVRIYAGRVWIAAGDTLWYSEPFQYSVFVPGRNYIQFPGKIILVAPTTDGLYVSTDKTQYFLGGGDPLKMTINRVAAYPAIPGTDVQVDGIAVGNGEHSNLITPMWTATQGICLGAAGGKLINLTHDRLVYPRIVSGCAVYTGKRYITCLDDGLAISLGLTQIAPTQYGNFSFNSMCKFGDKVLGANSSGIFVLESGGRDNGTDISAFFKLGPTDFGVENEKRLRRIYVGGRLDGRLKLHMSVEDREEEVVRELLPVDNTLRLTHQDVSGGRDLRGRFHSLKVANVAGADFTITNILAVLIILGQTAKEGA